MHAKIVGFSLIEMLVVITIVGIITAVAISAYNNYTNRAKFANAIELTQNVVTMAEAYYATHGVFPTSAQLNMPTGLGLSGYDPIFTQGGAGPTPSADSNCFAASYYVDTAQMGLGQDAVNGGQNFLVMEYLIGDVDGVITHACSYYSNNFDDGPHNIEFTNEATCEHTILTGAPSQAALLAQCN